MEQPNYIQGLGFCWGRQIIYYVCIHGFTTALYQITIVSIKGFTALILWKQILVTSLCSAVSFGGRILVRLLGTMAAPG